MLRPTHLIAVFLLAPAGALADRATHATVPDVFDMSEADAEAAIKRAGFAKVSLLKESACGSVVKGKVIEKGRVCHQLPPAGQLISRKISIAIRVQHENPWRGEMKNGRFWFLMPNMVGWSLDQARAKLKELGYAGEPSVTFDAKCKPDIVCHHLPRGLERADNTSGKTIVVGPRSR